MPKMPLPVPQAALVMPLSVVAPSAAAPPTAAERLHLKRAGRDDVVAEARAGLVQQAVDPTTPRAADARLPSRLVAALAAQAALDGDG